MAKRFPLWISLEEHGIVGGLGSALLEWLAEYAESSLQLRRLGVPDSFINVLGNQEYIRAQLGLDAKGLYKSILQFNSEHYS
ncbi:transketolase C-terminal/pyruvate-ferredoxin oxidoreductase domain II-containing protein [Synechococcus sp. A15-127]|nr:transketolase C-terminal/pyruvate-ferredoxin oxidoreductase domain II-containing protein [Synechococcus sp. A15-127]